MQDKTFQDFWDQIILPSAKELNESIEAIQLPRDLNSYKNELFKYYETLKGSCKNSMTTSMNGVNIEDQRIDRHKIAAVIAKSIIRTSPFALKNIPERDTRQYSDAERLANYILA